MYIRHLGIAQPVQPRRRRYGAGVQSRQGRSTASLPRPSLLSTHNSHIGGFESSLQSSRAKRRQRRCNRRSAGQRRLHGTGETASRRTNHADRRSHDDSLTGWRRRSAVMASPSTERAHWSPRWTRVSFGWMFYGDSPIRLRRPPSDPREFAHEAQRWASKAESRFRDEARPRGTSRCSPPDGPRRCFTRYPRSWSDPVTFTPTTVQLEINFPTLPPPPVMSLPAPHLSHADRPYPQQVGRVPAGYRVWMCGDPTFSAARCGRRWLFPGRAPVRVVLRVTIVASRR